MSITLGIDVGGSTTKIVGYGGGRRVGMLQVEATDPVTSAYGAFGKFITSEKLRVGDIGRIMLTGVGAQRLGGGMYDIPTHRVNEFTAIGLGGLALTGLDEAVVVSMGTGTALVRAANGAVTHLGGSGMGGGTLLNMCARFAGAGSFESITAMAAQGDLSKVDLTLADISPENIGKMPPETTASNFGNLSDTATGADIVLGIVNMIFESIGMMAVFAALNHSAGDVVLTGSLTTFPQAARVFDTLARLFPIRFHIPADAIFATAIGAALSDV